MFKVFRIRLGKAIELRRNATLTRSELEEVKLTKFRTLVQRLREILNAKHMDNVVFDVVQADDLPVSPVTRKFQLIVDARNPGG